MNDHGFMRLALVSPVVSVGDVGANSLRHFNEITSLVYEDAPDVIVFPELSMTGYSCGDLFLNSCVVEDAMSNLDDLSVNVSGIGGGLFGSAKTLIVFGMPILVGDSLYNCAVVMQGGNILGVVPKSYLPNYREFYESRWFTAADGRNEPSHIMIFGKEVPFGTDLIFREKRTGYGVGVEICEDVWSPIPPSSFQALAGAHVILNLSASNEVVAKDDFRRTFVKSQSGKLVSAYAYCCSGPTESTSDLVFGGHSMIGENGQVIAESKRFVRETNVLSTEVDVDFLMKERARMPQTFGESAKRHSKKFRNIEFTLKSVDGREEKMTRKIDKHPFVPSEHETLKGRCDDIFSIQCCGLAKRLESIPDKNTYIGVSGGLDSTLALLVAVKTYDMLGLDRSMIHGITMPGFGTSRETRNNAERLMELLGISSESVDIREMALQSFKDLKHSPFGIDMQYVCLISDFMKKLDDLPEDAKDLVFENVQARIRTFVLMSKGFVIGTGDLSEIALGWSTYNGDHMSMYNVNCSVPKTLVRFMVETLAEEFDDKTKKVLMSIAGTMISPELLPSSQSTEDTIGPYELHDFFLYNMIHRGFSKVKTFWLAEKAFDGKYQKHEISKWINVFEKRFVASQYKRNCVPDGPKVGTVSLSPRGDWRMPSDSKALL